MKRPVSSGAVLGAILKKDLRLYSRNKIYLFLTVLSLVFFVLIFWIMPDTVDETIVLAVSPPIRTMIGEAREALRKLGVPEAQLEQLDQLDFSREAEGLQLVELESEAELRRVIEGGLEVYRTADGGLVLRDPDTGEKKPGEARRVKPGIGIAFPKLFIADAARGARTTVTVYADAAVPEEIRGAMQSFVREIAYQLAGRGLPVELPAEEAIILGRDRAGDQASLRDKLRPMLAFFVLLIETFAMASLISTEILQRTVTALMVTPMRIWHFLAAKTVFGTGLALGQGLLVLALVGAFTPANWPLLLVTMLIGSIMFTGVAMLIGAAGKDFVSQLMYALLFTVPLMIPTFAVLFPGTAAAWIRAIPSYPVIDLLVGVTIYDAGWAESLGALACALLWVAILSAAGLFILKRKVESL
jgi:ABC-2 type transport system permease protein